MKLFTFIAFFWAFNLNAGVVKIKAMPEQGRVCKAFYDPEDKTLMPEQLKNTELRWTDRTLTLGDSVRILPGTTYVSKNSQQLSWNDCSQSNGNVQGRCGPNETEYPLTQLNNDVASPDFRKGPRSPGSSLLMPQPGIPLFDNPFFKQNIPYEADQMRMTDRVQRMEAKVPEGYFLVGVAHYTLMKTKSKTENSTQTQEEIDFEGNPVLFFVCPKATQELPEDRKFDLLNELEIIDDLKKFKKLLKKPTKGYHWGNEIFVPKGNEFLEKN